MRHSTLLVAGLVYAWAPNTTAAQSPVINPNASVVELRAPTSPDCPACTGCESTPGTFLDNCFETTSAVTTWLWSGGRTSPPNSMDQVLVRVGPGDFGRLRCDGAMNGWVSFEGSGQTQTRFVNDSPAFDPTINAFGTCPGGITVDECTELTFSDLTAWGRSIGVHWIGNGDSTWQSVDVTADSEGVHACDASPFYTFGWFDQIGSGEGTHYFFDSRITARGSTAFLSPYYSNAAETWMYASDLFMEHLGGGTLVATGAQIGGVGKGDLRLFGSTVRLLAHATTTGAVYGFVTDSTIHMHGGIVNLTALGNGTPSLSLVSIRNVGTHPNAIVHTPETAFVFNTPNDTSGNISRTRIENNGTRVDSPFLWPPSEDPPPIASTDGSDMFVKTNGGASGTESVLYLFDNDCPAPHWRSAADGTCL